MLINTDAENGLLSSPLTWLPFIQKYEKKRNIFTLFNNSNFYVRKNTNFLIFPHIKIKKVAER
jgi:hypothetical protein